MFQQKKPYTAVTVSIERLTSESLSEDDVSGIPDLVEIISLNPMSGGREAARALRKKLKYGSAQRQVRALVILDGLVANAGGTIQRVLAGDEPLLERLRVCGTSEASEAAVRRKCRELFGSWAGYEGRPGLERLGRLHMELPRRKAVARRETSRVVRETENPFEDDEPAAPASGIATPAPQEGTTMRGAAREKEKDNKAKKDGKKKTVKFVLEAEKAGMKDVMAEASVEATNLLNLVQSMDRETVRISQDSKAVEGFERCKQLRRKVLRYIHHVHHEQWLGPLLHVNDELVHALMTFEQLDQSVDADSDSDDELAEQAHLYRMAVAKGKETVTRETEPTPQAVDEDDEDDPFADRNMVDMDN